MKPMPKQKPLRLKGKKLQALKECVLARDDWTCQNPNCPGGSPIDSPHHIIFKSHGGSDVEENLVTLCINCHYRVHHVGDLKITPELEFIEGFTKFE